MHDILMILQASSYHPICKKYEKIHYHKKYEELMCVPSEHLKLVSQQIFKQISKKAF